MKPDVLETALAMDQGEVPLPRGSQSFRRASGADHLSKELIVGSLDLGIVHRDRALSYCTRSSEQQDKGWQNFPKGHQCSVRPNRCAEVKIAFFFQRRELPQTPA